MCCTGTVYIGEVIICIKISFLLFKIRVDIFKMWLLQCCITVRYGRISPCCLLCTGAVRCFPLSCRVELPARGDVNCSNPADVLPICPHPASALTTGCTGTQQVFWRAARCSSLSLVWITDQISDKGRAIVPGRICTDKWCSLVLLPGYFAATWICTGFLFKSGFGQFFFLCLKGVGNKIGTYSCNPIHNGFVADGTTAAFSGKGIQCLKRKSLCKSLCFPILKSWISFECYFKNVWFSVFFQEHLTVFIWFKYQV